MVVKALVLNGVHVKCVISNQKIGPPYRSPLIDMLNLESTCKPSSCMEPPVRLD